MRIRRERLEDSQHPSLRVLGCAGCGWGDSRLLWDEAKFQEEEETKNYEDGDW